MNHRARTVAIAGVAVVAVGLMSAQVAAIATEREFVTDRAVTVGLSERNGEDMWTYIMRQETGFRRTIVNYAPSDDAATMLVACLALAGHDARTLDHGGYAWTAPTLEERPRFDADLLRCRIAHPFPG